MMLCEPTETLEAIPSIPPMPSRAEVDFDWMAPVPVDAISSPSLLSVILTAFGEQAKHMAMDCLYTLVGLTFVGATVFICYTVPGGVALVLWLLVAYMAFVAAYVVASALVNGAWDFCATAYHTIRGR